MGIPAFDLSDPRPLSHTDFRSADFLSRLDLGAFLRCTVAATLTRQLRADPLLLI